MDRAFLAAVALASGSSLLLELALTRLLSVTTYYHFAFAVISGALLGIGLGSTVFGLMPDAALRGRERRLFGLILAAGSMVTLVALALMLGVPFTASMAILGVYTAAALLPFAAMGGALALALRSASGRPGIVYGADLLGAAAGALGFIPAADRVGAPGAILLASLGFAVAALLAADARWARRAAGIAATVALVAVVLDRTSDLTRVRYRKGEPAPEALETSWNAYSYVGVYHFGTTPFGWGFGDRASTTTSPPQLHLEIDGMASTVLTEFSGNLESVGYLRDDVTSVVYALVHNPRVFVMGVGGGRDILTAVVGGATAVTGVEINARILGLVTGRYAAMAGLAGRPGVRLVCDEARSFLTRFPEDYDVIQASLVDTWAASASGAFALSENGLYTVDGWSLFWRRLSPDGILTMSRWYRPGQGEVPRLVTLALDTLARTGVADPASHIVLVRGGPVATMLLRKSAFTAADLDRLERECEARGFEPLFLPGRVARDVFEMLATSPERWRSYAASNIEEDLGAPTDDRPFFFYRTRPYEWLVPAALLRRSESAEDSEDPLSMGALEPKRLLLGILVVAAALALLLLVVPPAVALRRDRQTAPGVRALFYMALAGLAFMLVEVPLLARLAIVLGHPLLSLAVVLTGLLVASGLGSLASVRLTPRGGFAVLLALPILVALLAVGLGPLAPLLGAFAGPGRVSATAAVVLLVGLPMGVPMPLGLAHAARRDGGRSAAMLFGVNVAFSVFGSIFAMVLLLNLGARATLIAGALAYALVAASGRRLAS